MSNMLKRNCNRNKSGWLSVIATLLVVFFYTFTPINFAFSSTGTIDSQAVEQDHNIGQDPSGDLNNGNKGQSLVNNDRNGEYNGNGSNHSESDTDPDTDCDGDSGGDCDGDNDTGDDGDCDTDIDSDTETDTGCDGDSDVDGGEDCDIDGDNEGDSDSHNDNEDNCDNDDKCSNEDNSDNQQHSDNNNGSQYGDNDYTQNELVTSGPTPLLAPITRVIGELPTSVLPLALPMSGVGCLTGVLGLLALGIGIASYRPKK